MGVGGAQTAQRFTNLAVGVVSVQLVDHLQSPQHVHVPLTLQLVDTFDTENDPTVILGRDVMFRFNITSTKALDGRVTLELRDRVAHTPLQDRLRGRDNRAAVLRHLFPG